MTSSSGIVAHMIIKGYNVVPLVKKTAKEIGDDRIPSLAAETAYYFFFSLFPLLLFLTPLLGLIGNGQQLMDGLIARLASNLPGDALSVLRRTLQEIVSANGGVGIMSVGALLAAWSGSSIFGSLMDALNVAYDVSESRPWWKRQALRLGCVVLSAIIVFLCTCVFLDGERIAQWAGHALNLGAAAMAFWTVAQLVLATALIVALCVALFKLLPNVQQRWGHVVVAALATTILWIVATLLFRLYVQYFGTYNKTYGAIGGVIALLSWMYYTMFVFLSGGELASELHHGSGAIDPIGGEIYLGRIVSQEGPGRASMEKVKPSR